MATTSELVKDLDAASDGEKECHGWLGCRIHNIGAVASFRISDPAIPSVGNLAQDSCGNRVLCCLFASLVCGSIFSCEEIGVCPKKGVLPW